jgi:hypothetical protein
MLTVAARFALTITFVALAVTLGKILQYTAVDFLEPRFGFDVASLIGLTPFFCALIWLRVKFPKLMTFRGVWQRPEND